MILLSLVLLAAPPAAAAHAGAISARLPDGRTLELRCAGQGRPTVILEAGWGSGASAWRNVMAPIAAMTRVCAYDRAGIGRSTAGPLPRDGAAIARDLDAGLRAARIDGPLVVVGHSTGALYARLLAARRPKDVVGMVLVDGVVEHQEQRFARAFGPGTASFAPLIARAAHCLAVVQAGAAVADDPARCAVRPSTDPAGHWRMRWSELATLSGATSAELDAGRRSYGAMPLVVLTAGRTYPGAVGQYWGAMHREVASRATAGEVRLIPDSGHAMMDDRPDAIVAAVADVIARARRR